MHTWRTGEGAREPLQLAGEVNQRDVAVGDGNGVVMQPADIKNLLDLLREAPGALLDPLQRLRLGRRRRVEFAFAEQAGVPDDVVQRRAQLV